MLLFPLPIYRHRRGRVRLTAEAPPVALTLVMATLDKNRAWVRLWFDRPVDLGGGGVAASSVWVDHAATATRYVATGAAAVLTPDSVRVTLAPGGSQSAPGTTLTATDGTGIAADDDGGTWGGAEGVSLPFP
jgi:hypothetical protein